MKKQKQKKNIPTGQLEVLSDEQYEKLPYANVYEHKGKAYCDRADEDGNINTVELGRIIKVDCISEDIDTGRVEIVLNNGRHQYNYPPSQLKPDEVLALADHGFDVNFSNRYCYYYYIVNLKSIAKHKFSHGQIGWGEFSGKIIFKLNSIITKNKITDSNYKGHFVIDKTKGTIESWCDGIRNLVAGHTGLEIVLLTSVCAVLNGLIGNDVGIDTPVMHIYNNSTVGKTTSLMVAASLVCDCNDKQSLNSSWSGTCNSLLNLLTNNFGLLMIFDDTSTAKIEDRAAFVYRLNAGKDKQRLNSNIQQIKAGSWKTMVLSSGEGPFLSEKEMIGGLQVRLLQFDNLDLAESAEHAHQLNNFASNNYGTAITPLVQGMMVMGKDKIISEFEVAYNNLLSRLDKGKYNARLAKIYTLFIISAKLLNQMFQLGIDAGNIEDFFVSYHNTNKVETDITERAWEYLKNTISIHAGSFEVLERNPFNNTKAKPPANKLYGNIQQCDGYCEVAIVKQICDELLEKGGFINTNAIYKAFQDKKYIVTDAGCFTQKRTVGSVRVRCVILNISNEMPSIETYFKKAREKRRKKN